MRKLNRNIGHDESKNHPEITHSENSKNVPYGSIAGIKIDAEKNSIEVANAGDVHVVSVDNAGRAILLTVDEVYLKDQRTLKKATKVARAHEVTPRYVMEHLDDPRFRSVVEEMYETMRLGNTGEIPRITGSSVFKVREKRELFNKVKQLIIFTDGAIPINLDIHSPEGLQKFLSILENQGLEGLKEDIERAAKQDPDFEKHSRIRHIDDALIIKLEFQGLS